MTMFQSKMEFLSVNSGFAVQNDGKYLPQITKDTCAVKFIRLISNVAEKHG